MSADAQRDLLREVLSLGENVIALCDVDERQISITRQDMRFGPEGVLSQTKAYGDYRKLFEAEKSLDAVIIATGDYWHVPLCMAAIKAGKHDSIARNRLAIALPRSGNYESCRERPR